MSNTTMINYKIAETTDEMKQIYQLNYETFVEEIPQHETNRQRKLVDRFHEENTYIIAKFKDEVIGMIAVRGNRPFSLDQKLDSLDSFLPFESIPCEVRLLSIKRSYRGGRVFYGLCERLVSFCLEKGYSLALISGTTRQLKLYRHIGFKPFGPLVGEEEAKFQPMYLTKESFEKSSRVFKRLMERQNNKLHHSFLPGPVQLNGRVKEAWSQEPISHRSQEFMETIENLKRKLCHLTNAKHAEIVVGTGTLANEIIAAQLTRMPGKGLVLSNGEFGERLVQQASRWNLPFYEIKKAWGAQIGANEVEAFVEKHPDITWIWHVHCETSTGFIFSLQEMKDAARKYDVRLCVDACSSVGVVPVDLSSVYLASTVSGKGLASYPGLAIIFHEERVEPIHSVPGYLDLGTYQQAKSVPFTHSSNSILALSEAVEKIDYTPVSLSVWVRNELDSAGMEVIGREETVYSPGIITVKIPEAVSSVSFGGAMKAIGIHLSYESQYLINHNWIQLALMGEQKASDVKPAIQIMTEHYQKIAGGTVMS